MRQVEATGRRYDVAHHVTWGSLRLGSQLWRLPVPLIYGPIGGGQVSLVSYWRFSGHEWAAETLRTASRSLLVLNHRTRETIRNSAVTLACNSATAAVSRRLGGADVRYMLPDGLPCDWVVAARRRPVGVPVVLWVGRLIPIKAPLLAVQAFAELRRAMPARLVIVGDGRFAGNCTLRSSAVGWPVTSTCSGGSPGMTSGECTIQPASSYSPHCATPLARSSWRHLAEGCRPSPWTTTESPMSMPVRQR